MQDDTQPMHSLSSFGSVPVEITVSVGKARPTIHELLELTDASVLILDKPVDAPVDLIVGGKLIGRGLLEEAEEEADQLVVRITEIVSPEVGNS